MQAPRWVDAWILILITVLITANPFYLNNRINLYELSLYLPGINGILHGLVPFKDFFHLRGPLELYMPAWLMTMSGVHVGTLCAYFFIGNVLCLAVLVLIAKELIRSRLIFYMMIPAIIARTFPRVCFMNWGGMRYAFGLLAVFCLIRFFKSRKIGWMVAAGVISAAAVLTSVEIGICAGIAAVGALLIAGASRLLSVADVRKGLIAFFAAGIIGITPWLVYSWQQQALLPYFEAMWTIITRFLTVINPHLASVYPSNLPEALAAMFNPGHDNFKQLTPAYTYLFLLGFLIWSWRKQQLTVSILGIVAVSVYGFVLYEMAFRALLASQFEMALMPEKIVYFFLIEAVILWIWQKKTSWPSWQSILISVLVMALFVSSLAYTLTRFNKRFWAFQWAASVVSGKDKPALKFADKNEQYEELTLERARGIWVPVDQALEIKQLDAFIRSHTSAGDEVLFFPELGGYNFIFDRPFVGRFPMSDLAWLHDQWFEEYLTDLKQLDAKYVIVQQRMPEDWEKIYFGYAPNQYKFNQLSAVIRQSYRRVAQTEGSWIYERK